MVAYARKGPTHGGRSLTLHSQIKKNTAPHELKPSDILIERFTAWKQIVKMLIGELGDNTHSRENAES